MNYLVNILLASFALSLVICDSSPEPPTNLYFVENADKYICLLFQSAIRLEFRYPLADNDTILVSNSTIIPKIDPEKSSKGNCSFGDLSNQQTLNIEFLKTWKLTFTFKKNATNSLYTMSNISLIYDLTKGQLPFPDAKTSHSKVDILVNDEWCDEYGSYICTGRRSYLPINANSSKPFVAMEMYNEQYNAFMNSSKREFTANVRRCTGDTISNLIPIVVGAALGGLIIIVLIAYIIGRHRSKKGYESV